MATQANNSNDMFAKFAATKPLRAFGIRSRVVIGLALTVFLIGGIGTWAGTAKLSGAIIGAGTVKVKQHVKEVQHRDGGTITSIAVRQGDHVTMGQTLLTLDDVQIRTELSILTGQIVETKGRQHRLIAERDGLPAIIFPKGFGSLSLGSSDLGSTDFGSAGFGSSTLEAAVKAGESKLFLGNLLNRTSQKSQMELQISQLDREVDGLSAQAAALKDEIKLVTIEQRKLQGLAGKGLTEGSKVYQIDREVARMKGEMAKIEANIAQSEARKSETRVRILAVDEAAHNEAQRELRTVDANIRELEDRYLAAIDRLQDTIVRSPTAGTINELGVTTIGGVITPAESLATIVPDSAELKIEFRVRTSDIDQISVGQSTKLKLSAFNQRTTPELDGIITHVSAAAQRDAQTGETFYLADTQIVDDPTNPNEQKLVPGMPVEVFVQTQERTAFSYLAQPFTDQFARAMRED